MTSKEVIEAGLARTGLLKKDLAAHFGCSAANFGTRLKKGTLTFNQVCDALDFMGMKLVVIDKEGGEALPLGNGFGPQVSRIVGGITYDTKKASMIATNRRTDDEICFSELYVTPAGVHFIAYYELWKGGFNRITVLGENEAQEVKRVWELAQ